MNNREQAIQALNEKGRVIIKCNGNSMRPIICPREEIHLIKVDPALLRVGDAVFCKVKGSLTVHKITAMRDKQYLIGNNHGFDNGWISANAIYGLCVQVEDRVIVSADMMKRRESGEI